MLSGLNRNNTLICLNCAKSLKNSDLRKLKGWSLNFTPTIRSHQ